MHFWCSYHHRFCRSLIINSIIMRWGLMYVSESSVLRKNPRECIQYHIDSQSNFKVLPSPVRWFNLSASEVVACMRWMSKAQLYAILSGNPSSAKKADSAFQFATKQTGETAKYTFPIVGYLFLSFVISQWFCNLEKRKTWLCILCCNITFIFMLCW